MAKRRSILTNNGERTYDQTIDGKRYIIEPGQAIELPRYEAVKVRGNYCGMNTPVNLAIQHLPFDDVNNPVSQQEAKKIFVSPDGREFSSKAGLVSHMRALAKKGDLDDSSTSTEQLQSAIV